MLDRNNTNILYIRMTIIFCIYYITAQTIFYKKYIQNIIDILIYKKRYK